MRNIRGFLLAWVALTWLVLGGLALPLAQADTAVNCTCEDIKCAPCEIESGTTFYSDRCGPGLSKVKSCQKRTCVKPSNYDQCLAELGRGVEQERKPAAVAKKPAEDQNYIGEVLRLEGVPKRISAKGGIDTLKLKSKIYTGDQIETGKADRVTIGLDPGKKFAKNEMVIDSSTVVKVAELVNQLTRDRSNTLINLMRGRLRTKVNNKVDGQASTFRVETRTAVAGVRGTDFITSFEPKGDSWVTTVQTLEGRVHVGRLKTAPEKDPASYMVSSEQQVSFTTAIPRDEKSKEEMSQIVAAGSFSETTKLDQSFLLRNDLSLINEPKTEMRKPDQAANDALCQEPQGAFNQCSFECVGGKSGDSKCRTDRTGVKCMRRICRANGKWLEPTQLPANQFAECPASGIAVRTCNQYW